VSIAIVIPKGPGASSARLSPKYVSPATAVVQIAVNGGAAQSFPVSGGSPCTNPPAGSGTCRVYAVNAPVGNDTFVVTLLDSANHVLSSGSTMATIAANTTNTVNLTFNGVVASLAVSITNASPPQGTPARAYVSLLPLDAAGYTLVGAPGSLPGINVSDSDSSGTTTLFLATDTTCSTPAGPFSTSVTTTQSGNGYTPVCIAYNGGTLPGGATITAASSGVPSASTTFKPAPASSASGAWVLGVAANNVETLEWFDANLNTVTAISGSSTGIDNLGPAIAIGADAAHVYVLTLRDVNNVYKILAYSATAAGNVAPVTTQIQLQPNDGIVGLAADGKGNAYTVVVTATGTTGTCQVDRVALSAGPQPLTTEADCTNILLSGYYPSNVHFNGALTELYVSYLNNPGRGPQQATIVKYRVASDGSLTPVSAIQPGYVAQFGLEPNGTLDVLTENAINQYPPSAFADGQTTSPPAPVPTYSGAWNDMAVDLAANIFVYDQPALALHVFPSSSHTLTGSVSFREYNMAESRTAPGGSGGSSVQAQPSTLAVPANNTITVSESGYTSQFTHSDDCAGKATIAPMSANGPTATFTVSVGASGGTCTVTFYDAAQHTAQVAIGVTATIITGQSKRRAH
jgi:hypothetical protein